MGFKQNEICHAISGKKTGNIFPEKLQTIGMLLLAMKKELGSLKYG
jgi:hypothetical protein